MGKEKPVPPPMGRGRGRNRGANGHSPRGRGEMKVVVESNNQIGHERSPRHGRVDQVNQPRKLEFGSFRSSTESVQSPNGRKQGR